MNVKYILTGKVIALLLLIGTMNAQCPQFLLGSQVGTIAHESLDEISGIVASRKNHGVLWAHNDSGGQPRVWALNTQGTHLGMYDLTDADNNDWEDIAIGPGPDPNEHYLYIGDVGNNAGLTNHTYTIYRVIEPNVSADQTPVTADLDGAATLLVQYPDSLRHGCETILVDPVNSDIYLCTRDRWNDDQGVMKVYRFPASQHIPNVAYILQHVADIQLMNLPENKPATWEMAVGGDISVSGSLVIIRTKPNRYNKGVPQRVLLWQRDPGTNLWDAFNNPVCVVPSVDEPQGEAVCFDPNGCGYYTISEDQYQPIYHFARDCKCPAGPGDLNVDCNVDLPDLAILVRQWQQPPGVPSADIAPPGGDKIVNMKDFGLLAGNWLLGNND
jgi:hypothetical protein